MNTHGLKASLGLRPRSHEIWLSLSIYSREIRASLILFVERSVEIRGGRFGEFSAKMCKES